MSISIVTQSADASAEARWRVWQMGYKESSEKAATQTRILFALAVIALAGVVTFQLLT